MSEAASEDLQSQLRLLGQLLGDTRARFHKRLTPFASSEPLIDLDRQIRGVLARPAAPESAPEVRRLIDKLRALDPH